MDPKRLAEIQERDRRRTPGRWRWWTSNSFRRLSSDSTGKDGDVLHAVRHRDGCMDIEGSDADRDFIEHASEDVSDLLDEVHRLTVERDALRGFSDRHQVVWRKASEDDEPEQWIGRRGSALLSVCLENDKWRWSLVPDYAPIFGDGYEATITDAQHAAEEALGWKRDAK